MLNGDDSCFNRGFHVIVMRWVKHVRHRLPVPPARCLLTAKGDRKSDSLKLCQFRETVGAPAFAAHSVMHEKEAVLIVLVFYRE